MLRLSGACLIILGSVGLGIYYRNTFQDAIGHLYSMQRILELFMSEIRYGKSTLHECLKAISKKVDAPYQNVLERIYERLNNREEGGFSVIWQEEMGAFLDKLPLAGKEKENFLGFAGRETFSDGMMQLRAIEQCRDGICSAIREREENAKQQEKLSLGLGTMGGLLLTVILF